jgi:predicted N-formylglutamate amidohydrolase
MMTTMTSFPGLPPHPAPFTRIEGGADARLLLICDHASAEIPAPLGDLGLSPEARFAHIAWDIGAAAVTRILADRLRCPAILSGVSRLVVDCNRPPGHAQSMPDLSGGVPVPGNRGLRPGAIQARLRDWFEPYHRAIDAELSRMRRACPAPAVISIHSFTPVMQGEARPWQVGVLWNRDPRLALPCIDRLSADGGLTVGDNQPYSGRLMNYSLDIHAGAAGLPHVSFELRQDLLIGEAAFRHWAGLLLDVLAPTLADPDLYRSRIYTNAR